MKLICGIIAVYLSNATVITKVQLREDIGIAVELCKEEKKSNGCLLEYHRHKHYAKIKCGEKL